MNNSIMGAAGNLPPSYFHNLNALQAQAQQNFASQLSQYVNQGLSAANQAYQPPAISLSGLETKVQRKISQAIDQLPMSLCARIATIQFRYAHENHPMRFVVVFTNNHTIEFLDVDGFPADEHIARIALECP